MSAQLAIKHGLFLAVLFILNCSKDTSIVALPDILHSQCAADLESFSTNISYLIVLPALRCPLGSCQNNPGLSCNHIIQGRPGAPSGDYWIRLCSGSAIQVYCDMSSRCCNSSTGWMRAAYLNMTDPTHNCPAGMHLGSDTKRLCRRKFGSGCLSIFFPVHYLVSSPDPFPYAHAREIIGGWRKVEGKGLANRVARATVGMLARLEWNAS